MPNTKKKDEGIIRHLDKAIDVLCGFSINEPEMGISELATKLGMYKSTVFRILKTLENRSFVIQNPQNQKYRLGFKLFELGSAVISNLEVREVAFPYMQQLGSRTNETVALHVAHNFDRVCIEKVESTESVRNVVQIGSRVPIFIAAPGKVLLANFSSEDIEHVLVANFGVMCNGLPVDKQKLLDELCLVRERGYAFSSGERSAGTSAVSAPIRNHEGKIIASLGLSGPEARFNSERIAMLINETTSTARKISERLGSRY